MQTKRRLLSIALLTALGHAVPGFAADDPMLLIDTPDFFAPPESIEQDAQPRLDPIIPGPIIFDPSIFYPDLRPTAISVPASAFVNGSLTMTSTVKNEGFNTASNFWVSFFLSSNPTISTVDTLIGYCFVSSLAGGASTNCNKTVTLPASATAGTYYVGVIADDENDVSETDETDNILAAPNSTVLSNFMIPIDPSLFLPDLTVPAIQYWPLSPTSGSSLDVQCNVSNQGVFDAVIGFRTGIYLSTNSLISTSDTLLGYCDHTSLAAGATTSCTKTVTLPAVTGSQHIGCYADYQGVLGETNNNNNTNSTSVTIGSASQPDLVANAVTAGASATVGGSLDISATTSNGGSAAAGGFTIGIYLSSDNSITTGDALVGYCTVPSLSVGSSYNCAGAITLPGSVAAGTYYYGMVADIAGEVTELSEANNTLLGAGTVMVSSTPAVGTTAAAEFYHPTFNHYFITAYPEEIAMLNSGAMLPWAPTGQTWSVWSASGSGLNPVCRFFSSSFAPKSSHFYTHNAAECSALQGGGVWTLEAPSAFYMQVPGLDGSCSAGTKPLYRLYNNGMSGAPNHRYTTSLPIRSSMITQGWIPEGYGVNGVFACIPN